MRYPKLVLCLSGMLFGSLLMGSRTSDMQSSDATVAGTGMQPLTTEERRTYYHLSEGSEVFPLQWLEGLQSISTNRPFLEHMDRFGLIADPGNELPIGISADTTRDVHFGSKPKMVGVTCAACHTGEFTYRGAHFVVDGAPSKFDLHAYYDDLFHSATSLRNNIQAFIQFYWKVSGKSVRSPQAVGYMSSLRFPMAQERPLASAQALTSSVDSDALLQSDDHFDQDVVAKLTRQLEEDRRTFDANPTATMAKIEIAPMKSDVVPPDNSVQPVLSLKNEKKLSAQRLKITGLGLSQTLEDLRTKSDQASADSVLIQIAPTREERSIRLGISFDDIRTQFRLLLARAVFLKGLSQLPADGTAAGLGRLDAFGNARDLLWPESQVPITAPVSYPALWNFRDEEYVHWDADTTSVIERNIGQALGLGAVLDEKTAMSTVNPRHLHELEELAAKFIAPKWPEAIFGPIDAAKSARGGTLYQAKCAQCHSPTTGEQILMSPMEVGTDRMRAENFAQPIGTNGFDMMIQAKMERIKAQAYKDNGITPAEAVAFDGKQPRPGQPKWRVTRKYLAVSLHGIWATSPYLHNGSVLNLHEMLLPSAQRRSTFFAGCTEFDPVNVGFVSDAACRSPSSLLNTSIIGNSNAGHEYGTTLSEPERMALIEYLKTL